MRKVECLMIDVNRDGYSPDQCGGTMTIRELIENLEDIARSNGDDLLVFARHDDGYTYGGFSYGESFEVTTYEEEGMNDDDEEETDNEGEED